MGHHESEETYQAIGHFMYEFSQLEYSIKVTVAEEAGVKDEFFDAIMVHDFSMLCTIAVSVLGKSRSSTKQKTLNKVIQKCRALNDERVRVAHGLWVPFREGGVVHHVPRSLKGVRLTDQAGHLNRRAEEANRCRFEFERAVNSFEAK